MKVLVTGAAGFIGMHTSKRLLERGDSVVGLDNLNAYYDVGLKRARLAVLEDYQDFRFVWADVADHEAVDEVFAQETPSRVIHLAAQAGVRYSLENPQAYVSSNLVGFSNLLEAVRRHEVEHTVYASSSSVYGGNRKLPFSERDSVDHPVSLYAATKKSNELMAHAYSHLFGIPTSGLRFFTVYGPWGRPDMALFKFTRAILEGIPIEVYNNGRMKRDFTYVEDVAESVVRVLDRPATSNLGFETESPDPATAEGPYRLFNVGNSAPVDLLSFISAIENYVGKTAEKVMLPLQPGDVVDTFADTSLLKEWVGSVPETPIRDGVKSFVDWYRDYYSL